MKKLFSLLLCLSIVFSLLAIFPQVSFAADSGTCGDDLTWTYDDGTLTISGTGDMYNYTSSNHSPWYDYRNSISTLMFSNDILSIGSYAFHGCASLTSVTIPDSVISIGGRAFDSCGALSSFTLGTGITSFGDYYIFAGCSKLKSINITDLEIWCGKTLNTYNPLSGRKLSINGEIVTDLVIPNGITKIGNYTFYGCTSITNVTIPDTVTVVGRGAFDGCKNIKTVEIPESITTIEDYAFSECRSITSITIPDYVTSIGFASFANCRNLSSITIGKGITSFGSQAFFQCGNLKVINITDLETWCNKTFESTNPLNGRKLSINGEIVTDLVIPDGITEIRNYVFYGCTSITSVSIPDSVKRIGVEPFGECKNIKSLTIPGSVTAVGAHAFYDCTSMTDLTILEGVTNIGDYAFCNCTSLKSVTIPNSIKSLSNKVFKSCYSIENLTLGSLGFNIYYPFQYSRSSIKQITIEDGITSIPANRINNLPALDTLIIPESVTSIENGALDGSSLDLMIKMTVASHEAGETVTLFNPGSRIAEGVELRFFTWDGEVLATEAVNSETGEVEYKIVMPDHPVELHSVYALVGDADQDEMITLIDISVLKKILAGGYETSAIQLEACDVNGDGKNTLIDIQALKKLLA